MTGNELLNYLQTLPQETLEQNILFEVKAWTSPTNQLVGRVHPLTVVKASWDYYLTPDGAMNSDDAIAEYRKYQAAVKDGEFTEEEVKPYMPFHCPKLISKGQLLIGLQSIKAGDFETPESDTPSEMVPFPYLEEVEQEEPVMKVIQWTGAGEA